MPRRKRAAKVSAVPASKSKKKAPAKKSTRAKAKKAAPAKVKNPCICGCGGTTGGFFVQGHDARYKGWLKKIARGDNAPKDLMPTSLVKALGPWKKKGDGQIPSKKYQDLRAA